MREGVHRVDTPLVTRVVVRGMTYAVDRGVAQVDIGAGHVNFGAQYRGCRPLIHRPAWHESAPRFSSTLRDRNGLSVPACAEITTVDTHVFCALLVHVSQVSA